MGQSGLRFEDAHLGRGGAGIEGNGGGGQGFARETVDPGFRVKIKTPPADVIIRGRC